MRWTPLPFSRDGARIRKNECVTRCERKSVIFNFTILGQLVTLEVRSNPKIGTDDGDLLDSY